MNEDPRDHHLDAAYRRASEAEAGRPDDATRAAIRAEAAAAARRRLPASNESRYLWSAVAGLAVIGVAVLIWRQTDVDLPGTSPDLMVSAEAQGDLQQGYASGSSAAMAAGEAAPAAEARTTAAAPGTTAATEDANRGPDPVVISQSARDASAGQEAAQKSVEPVRATSPERREAARSAAAPAPEAAPPPPPAAVSASADDAAQLVRRHFPAQYESRQFHRLWLVRDADGQVLISGELEQGQRYEDAEEQLRGLQGQTPGPWQVRQLRNGAGQLIELAIAEVELGEPRR